MVNVVTMLDCIGANEPEIPHGTVKIGYYTTQIGTPKERIIWVPGQIAEWNTVAGLVPINQNPMTPNQPGVSDVEPGAYSISQAVTRAKALGANHLGDYVNAADAAELDQQLTAAGIPASDIWLANWNLNEEAAASLVGTKIGGRTIRAVQWASPSSNPNTIVPGGTKTLSEAGIDISAADASWFPVPVAPVPPPVIPVVTVQVTLESADNGKTWKVA